MGLLGKLLGSDKDLEAIRLFNLGAAYARGDSGLAQDDREAARLYKQAADRGLAEAQYFLGTFYESSRGGLPQNDRKQRPITNLPPIAVFRPHSTAWVISTSKVVVGCRKMTTKLRVSINSSRRTRDRGGAVRSRSFLP
jgi:hypothetical protein